MSGNKTHTVTTRSVLFPEEGVHALVFVVYWITRTPELPNIFQCMGKYRSENANHLFA